jgi:hypothetical protein
MYICTHSLTLALDGGGWSASRSGRFTPRERAPGAHWIRGWIGPRDVLDAVVKIKISSPRQDSNTQSSSSQPNAIPLSYPGYHFVWDSVYSLFYAVLDIYDILYAGHKSDASVGSGRQCRFLDWYGFRFSTTFSNVFVIELRDAVVFSVVQTLMEFKRIGWI